MQIDTLPDCIPYSLTAFYDENLYSGRYDEQMEEDPCTGCPPSEECAGCPHLVTLRPF